MMQVRHCCKGTWIALTFIASFSMLLCGSEAAKAQDLPASQQLTIAERPVKPTTQTSNVPTVPPEDARTKGLCDLPKNSGDGLVIISATLPPKTRHAGYPMSFRYTYKLKDGGWRQEGDIVVNSSRGFRNARSEFDGVFGKLFVLKLPAGSYQFKDWEYAPLAMRGTERPIGIHPLPFNVESGRAVYLGGFDPTLTEGRNLLHLKVNEAWPLVHDDETRDLPVFFNRCPGFDRNLLDVRVMDTTPWRPPEKK